MIIGTKIFVDEKGQNYGLDHVDCNGDEENLLSCEYVWRGKSDSCIREERAGVACSTR